MAAILAWGRTGDKPLSESMLHQIIDAYMRDESNEHVSYCFDMQRNHSRYMASVCYLAGIVSQSASKITPYLARDKCYLLRVWTIFICDCRAVSNIVCYSGPRYIVSLLYKYRSLIWISMLVTDVTMRDFDTHWKRGIMPMLQLGTVILFNEPNPLYCSLFAFRSNATYWLSGHELHHRKPIMWHIIGLCIWTICNRNQESGNVYFSRFIFAISSMNIYIYIYDRFLMFIMINLEILPNNNDDDPCEHVRNACTALVDRNKHLYLTICHIV